MRKRSTILSDPRVRKLPTRLGIDMVEFNGRHGTYHCAFCADEEGWEHVSVSPVGSKYDVAQPCPTWDQMCEVKRLFWDDDEMAVQLHPPESQYLHGIVASTNILHLWRPADGGWSLLDEKELP